MLISAILLYSVLIKISPVLPQLLNVFNLVVLIYALEEGEVYGACLGTVCGLIQDSFSIGVFGIAGISKTLMGFLAGYISRRINVVPFARRIVFIFFMFVTEILLWMMLYSFVISDKFYTAEGILFLQPALTTIFALLVFPPVRKLMKRHPHR
jgi:rod shape-determining protein MreD